MDIRLLDRSEWEAALPASGFEPFHLSTALAVVERHTPGELQLYGGFKGDQPVGLLPLFVEDRSLGYALLSPPPSMGIHRLGPILMPASPKQRKRERVNRTFIEGVLEQAGVSSRRTILRMLLPTTYTDPRPYHWAGLNVEVGFTYRLETDGSTRDELLGSFSKSLRREIRAGNELDVTIDVEGTEGARAVYEDTVSRYTEQNRDFALQWDYVRDLTDALVEDDRCRVYVARTPDGEFISGITVLYSNDAAYFWQGGARTTYENVSINSLLHWRIIEDLLEDPPLGTVTKYDLMGANTERLCQYKSKFGTDLVPYYIVESKGPHIELAKKAYKLVAR